MLNEADKAVVRLGAYIAQLEQKLVEQAKTIEQQAAKIRDHVAKEAAQAGSDDVEPVQVPTKSE